MIKIETECYINYDTGSTHQANSYCCSNGIKVIKNNYNKSNLSRVLELPKRIHTLCENCDSELEITEKHTHVGWLGLKYITCPCCGKESCVEELEETNITKDNIKFPTHFRRVVKTNRGTVDVKEDEINKNIQKGLEYLRTNKNEFYWYIQSGDLFLIIFRYEDDEEYTIMVTKDYFEANVSFEYEDF